MKHLEVRQKYSAARRIFNSLLGVSSGDETLHLMFDILLHSQAPLARKFTNRIFESKGGTKSMKIVNYIERHNFSLNDLLTKLIVLKYK